MEDKLTAVITVIRHGEKNESGELTADGLIQSIQRGVATNHVKGDMILFHSGVSRVRDTVKFIAQHLPSENGLEEKLDIEDFNLQDYEVPSLHYLHSGAQKGNLFSKWDNLEALEMTAEQRINNFLSQQDQSLESEIYPSPAQMAKNISKIILTQIDFALLTSEDYTTNFINGTHEPVISAFLYYYFNKFEPKVADSFIESIGGCIKFAEGFDIYVYQSKTNISRLKFVFRGVESDLDIRAIRKFLRG